MKDNFNFNDDEDNGGGDEWLATYGDLVTLLLCFFVLLYSMSTVDAQKFKAAAESLSTIGIVDQKGSTVPGVGDSVSNTDASQSSKDMENIYNEVKQVVDEKGLSKEISIHKNKEGILLRFEDKILFDSAEAVLKDNSKSLLDKLAEILKKHNKEVKIEGHTDNVPIRNDEYKDNWELSAARAINVVKFFSQDLPSDKRISPEKFEASGYGEYHPISPNNSEENKHKNRRIEIFIKK